MKGFSIRAAIMGLLAAVLLILPAVPSAGETPRHGLMWNRSGLPLVFPLIVRSDPGRDYFVVLHDTEKRKPVLAAYVEGGRFFRVLTPPGTFHVEISFGEEWRDETRLFGPETGKVRLEEALTFEVRNFSTKGGHVIDLRGLHSEEASLRSRVLRICQGVWLAAEPPLRAWEPAEERAERPGEAALLELPGPLDRQREPFELDLVLPDVSERPTLRTNLPRWQVRYRIC